MSAHSSDVTFHVHKLADVGWLPVSFKIADSLVFLLFFCRVRNTSSGLWVTWKRDSLQLLSFYLVEPARNCGKPKQELWLEYWTLAPSVKIGMFQSDFVLCRQFFSVSMQFLSWIFKKRTPLNTEQCSQSRVYLSAIDYNIMIYYIMSYYFLDY